MKQYLIGVLIAGIAMTAVGFVLRAKYGPSVGVGPRPDGATPPAVVASPPPVDAHGCDVAGGWVWCEPKEKCLQLWDEKCEGVVSATESAKPSVAPSPKSTQLKR